MVLFPLQPNWSRTHGPENVIITDDKFTIEELALIGKQLKTTKAPGLDGIPNELLKTIIDVYPEILLKVYNACLKERVFFKDWKRQRLILLRKGNKPLNEPSSFRPICLMDTMGKVLEGLILLRLNLYLDQNGGLSDRQYGFRKGRSTVDAIKEVVEFARNAKDGIDGRKGFCALISIDIKNAFNSVRWKDIIESLIRRNVPEYLINLIENYFSERIVLFHEDNVKVDYEMTGGAPQGSKIGPVLWNVMYDSFLEMELPDNTKIIGFADDAMVICASKNTKDLEVVVNDSLERVYRWLVKRKLTLAVDKTEAILVTDRRSFDFPKINICDKDIKWGKTMTYLGVELDQRLSFHPHITNRAIKTIDTVASISRLMPNIGGPKEKKRRLLCSVANSKLLYAAPIWADALNNKRLRQKMASVQRRCALRITSAYRTVSESAVLVLASTPPIDLLAMERKEVYEELRHQTFANDARLRMSVKREARRRLLQKWQDRWNSDQNGRWTHRLIPRIEKWVERTQGEINYFTTQALTGHGSFNAYLYRFKLIDSANCDYCDATIDDAEHSLFHCVKWNRERASMSTNVGDEVTPDNIVELMLSSESKWITIETFIRSVISKKVEDRKIREGPGIFNQAD